MVISYLESDLLYDTYIDKYHYSTWLLSGMNFVPKSMQADTNTKCILTVCIISYKKDLFER